jgi:hypothetical protein
MSEDPPREFRCPECGRRVTRGPSGTEYGHQRTARDNYGSGVEERCPRRPETVDPVPQQGVADD